MSFLCGEEPSPFRMVLEWELKNSPRISHGENQDMEITPRSRITSLGKGIVQLCFELGCKGGDPTSFSSSNSTNRDEKTPVTYL